MNELEDLALSAKARLFDVENIFIVHHIPQALIDQNVRQSNLW